MICRIKYLIDNGVEASKICMSAFNIDAAQQIKKKLKQLLGVKGDRVRVNNIDKLARQFLFQNQVRNEKIFHVKEFTVQMIRILEQKRHLIRENFEYFFFDEFQDVSEVEFDFVKLLWQNGVKVGVIGDDAQNIYSFRDSVLEIIQSRVDEEFHDLKVFQLSFNYRSSVEIIRVANQVVGNSKNLIQKSMNAVKSTESGEKPEIRKFISIQDQNIQLIQEIQEELKKGRKIAILCRSNKPLQFFEEELQKWNKGQEKKISFYSQITEKNQEKLANKEESLPAKETSQKVVITTIHKAKGLEWDSVFIINCNDEFFPGGGEIEEERRIFYVAITRAKQRLFICFTENSKARKLTRFCCECENKLFQGYNFVLDAWEFEEKMEESETETTKRKFDKSEVEEFVASLGPQQYEFLRKQNNLLDENVKIENIHETEKVPETVLQLGIENDFFRFVEKILLREIFVRFKENKECQTPNVNVNQNNYLKDDFFALNVLYGGQDFTENQQSLNISGNFIQEISQLQKFEKSFKIYCDTQNPTLQIRKEIYDVSIMETIFRQRRKILFVENAFHEMNKNPHFLKQVCTQFCAYLTKNSLQQRISIKKELFVHPKSEENNSNNYFQPNQNIFHTYAHLIVEKTLYEIRFSNFKGVKVEWILTAQIKASILQSNYNTTINTIRIYNPLQGNIYSIENITAEQNLALMQTLNKIKNLTPNKKQESLSKNSHNSTPKSKQQNNQSFEFEKEENFKPELNNPVKFIQASLIPKSPKNNKFENGFQKASKIKMEINKFKNNQNLQQNEINHNQNITTKTTENQNYKQDGFFQFAAKNTSTPQKKTKEYFENQSSSNKIENLTNTTEISDQQSSSKKMNIEKNFNTENLFQNIKVKIDNQKNKLFKNSIDKEIDKIKKYQNKQQNQIKGQVSISNFLFKIQQQQNNSASKSE